MESIKEIYLLTVVYEEGEEHRTRCYAWFPNYEMAVEHLYVDTEFYFENGYYNYCVIERSKPGINLFPDQFWFKIDYDRKTRTYTITKLNEPPESCKQTCNFGIG